jgi:hypothetical protein
MLEKQRRIQMTTGNKNENVQLPGAGVNDRQPPGLFQKYIDYLANLQMPQGFGVRTIPGMANPVQPAMPADNPDQFAIPGLNRPMPAGLQMPFYANPHGGDIASVIQDMIRRGGR